MKASYIAARAFLYIFRRKKDTGMDYITVPASFPILLSFQDHCLIRTQNHMILHISIGIVG